MSAFTVDFSKVEDKGYVEAGKYIAKIEKISREEGQSAPYLKWELVILTGKAKGLHINHITSLKPEALFNLRNTLLACGLNVPKSAVKLDPAKLVGRQLGIEVTMREYEGKEYPNVKKTMTVDDMKASMGAEVTSTHTPASEISSVVDDMDLGSISADDL